MSGGRTSCSACRSRTSAGRTGVPCAWFCARFLGASGSMNSLLCPSLRQAGRDGQPVSERRFSGMAMN